MIFLIKPSYCASIQAPSRNVMLSPIVSHNQRYGRGDQDKGVYSLGPCCCNGHMTNGSYQAAATAAETLWQSYGRLTARSASYRVSPPPLYRSPTSYGNWITPPSPRHGIIYFAAASSNRAGQKPKIYYYRATRCMHGSILSCNQTFALPCCADESHSVWPRLLSNI